MKKDYYVILCDRLPSDCELIERNIWLNYAYLNKPKLTTAEVKNMHEYLKSVPKDREYYIYRFSYGLHRWMLEEIIT